jgi:hypothetical protein
MPDYESDGAVPDGSTCKTDLSNIGTADFRIALTMTTTKSGLTALINQRSACGPGMFWDVRVSKGKILVETDDSASYATSTSTFMSISNGHAHAVLVRRTAGVITIFIDGAASGSLRSSSKLGQLPALKVGTDVCDGVVGETPFVGTISNLCITNP